MIERVYNDELGKMVYQIKKSDFMKGLNKEKAEQAWCHIADIGFVSIDFEYYHNASAFRDKLVNYYSCLL